MGEQRKSFLEQVQSQIKSKEAKVFVSAELHHHLNKVKNYWLQKGISEDQAEEKAVTQMGNPISIGRNLNRIYRPKIDWVTLVLFVAALLLGFLPLLSQGYMSGNHFSMYKAIFVVLGGILALGLMFIDYRKMANKGWLFYLLGTLLLLFLTRHFNTFVDGQAVFKVGPLKMEGLMAIPFFLMAWAGFFQSNHFRMWQFLLLFVLSSYFFLQFSLTTLFIYVTMTFTMIWWSKLNKKKIAIVLRSGFALVAAWGIIRWMTVAYYQKQRLLSFINPYNSEEYFGLSKVHHLFMDAGWFGKHLLVDQMIPQANTNFVFLSFTYYYGWLFATILFLVLSLVVVRITFIAKRIGDSYTKLLLVGIMIIYTIQLVGHVGMIVGFFPMTNMSLPFISYGLMPVLLNAFLIGIVLSIYRRKDLLATNTLRGQQQ